MMLWKNDLRNGMKKIKSDTERLVQAAKRACRHAYAPYSKFKVGAALLTESGEIFSGCNVENASYGLTICAERVAIAKAVSEGESKFIALAIAASGGDSVPPCGACRQVMSEFARDLKILIISKHGKILQKSLQGIFPEQFGNSYLK